jgi:hypothetical protein
MIFLSGAASVGFQVSGFKFADMERADLSEPPAVAGGPVDCRLRGAECGLEKKWRVVAYSAIQNLQSAIGWRF